MIFRILSHPESKHDAFLRMLRCAWNEQEEPNVRGLSIRVGCSAGLSGDLTRFRERKREHSLLLIFRFYLPDRVAQGVHSGNDPAPERRRRAGSQIKWCLQEFSHYRGYRRMNESLLQRTIVTLRVAILRTIFIILVKKRLSSVADVVYESRSHPKSAIHERCC